MASAPVDEQTLPPIKELDRTLGVITERIAHQIAVPTPPPVWSDFDWAIARAVATMQGVAPLLIGQAEWNGHARWSRFLLDQRDSVAGRHLRIEQLLDEIDLRSQQQGLAVLPLKGAALHAIGVYSAGDRPMADIDLLVRDCDLKAMSQVLQGCGFQSRSSNRRHELFESPSKSQSSTAYGEHIDSPIKIELHSSIRESLPVSEIDITHFLFPQSPKPGLNPYQSGAALMLHLLLHAANNMRAHALRFIQLVDIARLAKRFDSHDWLELLGMRMSGQTQWWAAPPLILTSKYFPSAIPNSVNHSLSAECPWLLRKRAQRYLLTDVSWSNIRVYALPGIEWCRTPLSALRFMANRILPDREMREEMHRFDLTEGRDAPVPWYGISQRARIARWIVSRPPRVQTLMAVRNALAQDLKDSTDELGRKMPSPS